MGSRRRRGSAAPAPRRRAGRSSRAAAIVQRWSSSDGSGWSAIRVPGFARKFWTITSWRWPWRRWSARERLERLEPLGSRVSPIPIRIPLVKGIRSSPASSIVSSRRAGSLSGEAQCGPPRSREPIGGRLEHDPHRGGDRAKELELGAGHDAGIQVREQAGLVEHEPRDAARGTRSSSRSRARASSSRATL